MEDGVFFPSDYFSCWGSAPIKTTFLTINDYQAIVNSVISQYEGLKDVAEDNTNPRGHYAACLVRLTGHDFMDFRVDSANPGGQDGCMDFTDDPHLGVKECIKNMNFNRPYATHCTKVSLADYFVIAAEGIMGRTASDYNPDDKFNSNTLLGKYMNCFKYGRTTVA